MREFFSGPKHFLIHINDLRTPCPIYKYVDDSTIFEICNQSRVSVIQDSANIIVQWSSDNDMLIDTNKTQEMVSVKIERMLNLCHIFI